MLKCVLVEAHSRCLGRAARTASTAKSTLACSLQPYARTIACSALWPLRPISRCATSNIRLALTSDA